MDIKSKIILIAGPTASGKSSFAVNLAKKINGEIINADSMQVYKEIKILTARPLKKDQKNIIHHLYGFQSVKNNFSTGSWLKLSLKKIKQIRNKKKIPIIVGGTGLYFKSLTDGLVKIPKIPLSFRNKIRTLQKKIGQEKFYEKLLAIDPRIIKSINPNDVQRSIRAYEIKKYTNISIYEWYKKTEIFINSEQFLKLYLDFPRNLLLERIKKRIDVMLNSGAINEVKKFKKLKIKNENMANRVIGIKEIDHFISGGSNFDETAHKMLIKTRQYAKRQKTWARGQMKDWQKLKPNDHKVFLKKLKI